MSVNVLADTNVLVYAYIAQIPESNSKLSIRSITWQSMAAEH